MAKSQAAPQERPLIPGQVFELNGTSYTVPPMLVKDLKKYMADLTSIAMRAKLAKDTGENPLACIPKAIPIILAAMKRNYPDLTEGAVEDFVDLGNFEYLLNAACGISREQAEAFVRRQAMAVTTGEPQPAPGK